MGACALRWLHRCIGRCDASPLLRATKRSEREQMNISSDRARRAESAWRHLEFVRALATRALDGMCSEVAAAIHWALWRLTPLARNQEVRTRADEHLVRPRSRRREH